MSKKVILIAILVLALIIGLVVWLYQRGKTPANSSANQTAKTADSTDAKYKALIAEKMEQIRGNAEWFEKIKGSYQKDSYTLAQALALNAVWALKVDGVIPMNTYGDGEWGHSAYVRLNY